MLSRLYQRVVGHPFVYNHVRPLIVGGIDMSATYENLAAGPEDVIVDVGCGTGDALNYLGRFGAYHGFDIDGIAVANAERRFPGRHNVFFHDRALTADDLARIQPTRIVLAGLLHHLDDADALALLRMCVAVPSVARIATQDVVFVPGEHVNNLLARLDRGKHVRTQVDYEALVRRAGANVSDLRLVRSHPRSGRALLLLMTIARRDA